MVTYLVEVAVVFNLAIVSAGFLWRKGRKSPVSQTQNMSKEFDYLNG